ncbi:hypothetical protein RB195_004724 [Necator americanus]|uniref:Uncharacterized protein n=1 Tax=Necator americanus TaxID=51031 RepID=A0ABR1BMP4_NECAM
MDSLFLLSKNLLISPSVTRTSVRPKAYIQVTGRWKRVGLEFSPTNRLHLSNPRDSNVLQNTHGSRGPQPAHGLELYSKHSHKKESSYSGGKPGRVAPGRVGLEESSRLPERKRTKKTICTYDARTLASEAAIEDLMMQAKKIKYDVIGLTEMKRRHPLYAAYETGEEVFSGACDSRGVIGVGVLVNKSIAINIGSFEQLSTRIGHLRTPSSSYEEEEVEVFYVDLEKFYREDHTFYNVIVGYFHAKIGPKRTPEELHINIHGLEWNEQVKWLSIFIMTSKTIHPNWQEALSSLSRADTSA